MSTEFVHRNEKAEQPEDNLPTSFSLYYTLQLYSSLPKYVTLVKSRNWMQGSESPGSWGKGCQMGFLIVELSPAGLSPSLITSINNKSCRCLLRVLLFFFFPTQKHRVIRSNKKIIFSCSMYPVQVRFYTINQNTFMKGNVKTEMNKPLFGRIK